jgi:serralysin
MSTAFRIILDASQEVGTGSTSIATGLGTVVFDSVNTTASYFFTVFGLDFGELLDGGVPDTADPNDDVTAMHIHGGARGANGGVAFDLLPLAATDDDDDFVHAQNLDGSRSFSGVWETTDAANVSLNTFAAALTAATPGNDAALYFNIHTAQFGGGAIRGQWVCIADDNANAVAGTAGDDRLPGLGGNDTIDGGAGDDAMSGGTGNDTYTVESSGDTITELAGQGYDTVNTTLTSYTLGANVERVNFTGVGNFLGTGNGLANRFQSGAGNDRFVDVLGGADIFSGGAGTDVVDFRASASGATINLATGVHAGAAAGDSYSGIERFWGSNTAADTMTGDAAKNSFYGFGGNDTLTGGGHSDRLEGGAGDDTLAGGLDKDILNGGASNDTLTGGAAADSFEYATASFGEDTVTDFVDGVDKLKVFTGVADDVSDFFIAGNGTTVVTLELMAAPTNIITLNGLAAITITNADFVF